MTAGLIERMLNALGWYRWWSATPIQRWSDGSLTGFRDRYIVRSYESARILAASETSCIDRVWVYGLRP